MIRDTRISDRIDHWRARAEAAVFGAAVGATDLLPPRIRYGYVHAATAKVLGRSLPQLTSAPAVSGADSATTTGSTADPGRAPDTDLTCVLAAGALDVGGIGSVVEILADGLPSVGIRPVIICTDEGRRVQRLRGRGVEVTVARTCAEAAKAFAAVGAVGPVAVQLHGAPDHLVDAALARPLPVIPVFHNTEIHYTRARWARLDQILHQSPAAIAVSELVRDFHAAHLSPSLGDRLVVVANAVRAQPAPTADQRAQARARLEATLGRPMTGAVFVSLARYDAQKNVAGLVAAATARATAPYALVVAGEPSDWVEWRRAEAIRRSSPGADRVALLGISDARTLLAAGDAFVLDSFFEGWPVAATEAAAAGLPLLLSDVGGARELVARDPDRSRLVANPCGPAATVSDATVAVARRRSRHQTNHAELEAALIEVAERVREPSSRTGSGTGSSAEVDWMEIMMRGHEAAVRAAVKGRTS